MDKPFSSKLATNYEPYVALDAFISDMTAYIATNEAFEEFTLSELGLPARQLSVTLRLAPHIDNISEAYRALLMLWTQIAFRHFQATSCKWKKKRMMFEFATCLNENSGWVTGLIEISGENYEAVARKFEEKFSKTLADD